MLRSDLAFLGISNRFLKQKKLKDRTKSTEQDHAPEKVQFYSD